MQVKIQDFLYKRFTMNGASEEINILEKIQDQQKSTFWKKFEIKSSFKTTKYFKLPCGPVMIFDDGKTIDKSFHSKFGEKKNKTLMTDYILDLWGMLEKK